MTLTRKTLRPVAYALGVALAIFQILFTGGFFALEAPLLRGIHLSAIMVLIFLLLPARKRKDGQPESSWLILLDIGLAVLAAAVAVYFYVNLDVLLNRIMYVDEVTSTDMFFGIATILLVLEVTRRTSGWSLVLVAAGFLLYAMFGQYLPNAINHTGVTGERLVEQLFLLTDGIYGVPIAVGSTMIFAFIMFGAFLERSTMSSVFMDASCLLTKNSKGGPAKVAIFASALFGTISGSAPANVYGTGTFTIPLMKKVGYAPHFAGAVEAVASTGGQIMPPVMGAAAFIMADITGLGYVFVAKAALLPAVLYYLALLAMIHFEAVRNDLGYLPPELVPATRDVMMKLYYLFPIVILIFALWMGRSVVSAAFLATLSIVILGLFRPETRLGLRGLMDALELASRNAMMISACCAAAGIIVGVISMTGIGYKFISAITDLAGGNLFILMLFLTVTCIVLGMGVPTTPAYIIVATLGAPALMKAGVPMIAAHLFVFYYAILSVITPPVCMAAFSGAAIADAPPMKTGFTSSKLGIVAFIIPFMFVYEPALLLQGSPVQVVQAVITAIIGVVGLAAGMQGWFVGRASMIERVLLVIGGLTLIYPGAITDILGFALLICVAAYEFIRDRRGTASATTADVEAD